MRFVIDAHVGAPLPVICPRRIRGTYSVPPSFTLMLAEFDAVMFVFALQSMPAYVEPMDGDMSISVPSPATVSDPTVFAQVGV